MADEKKINGELSDEELNEAAGGFTLPSSQLGFVECATEGCKNKFRPLNGEKYCQTCRTSGGSKKIF